MVWKLLQDCIGSFDTFLVLFELILGLVDCKVGSALIRVPSLLLEMSYD